MTITLGKPAPHQLPVEASISSLDPDTKTRVIKFMEGADNVDQIDVRRAFHACVATLMGIQLPAREELALCTCGECYCDLVFDAWLAGIYLDGTVERVQCPACLDDHRQTGD